jgi:hypothetical protein
MKTYFFHHFLICWLFLLIILFGSCKHNLPLSGNLLEMGDYKITGDDFIVALNKNKWDVNDTMALFDNLISSGILVNHALNKDYMSNPDVQNKLKYWRDQLIIKYWIDTKIRKEEISDNDIKKSYNRFKNKVIEVNYTWVPGNNNKMYNEILKMIRNEERFEDFPYKPSSFSWDSAGIRFFQNKLVEPGTFIGSVERKILRAKIGDILELEANHGRLIIKILAQLKDFKPLAEKKEEIRLRIALAKQFEAGNLLYDDAYLISDIKMDPYILTIPYFNFFINPIQPKDIKPGIIARFKEREYTSDDIRKKISILPQSLQALFRNRYSRANAIAILLLFDNGCIPASRVDGFKDKIFIQEYIKKQLFNKSSLCLDTINTVYNSLSKQLLEKSSNRLYSLLKENAYKSDIGKDIFVQSKIKNVKDRTNPEYSEFQDIISIKTDYNPWPAPEAFEMTDALQIDFYAIENLIIEDITVPDDQVIASGSNWRFTVKDFNKIISKLTPKSRINMAKHSDVREVVCMLAGENHAIRNEKDIHINYDVFKKIDIVGHSIDSVNFYKSEGLVLASLHGIEVTLNDLRNMVALLPPDVKKLFLNSGSRIEPFEKLIVQKYRLNQKDINSTIQNAGFIKEMKKYTNLILAESLYNKEIHISPFELPDEKLNFYLREVINILNQQRLKAFLLQSKEKIKVNRQLARLLGINTKVSKYYVFIN